MMQTLTEALNNGQEATAQEALELMIDFAENQPRFLRRQIVEVVGYMLQIAEADDRLEEGTRHLAVEFVVTLAEAREKAPGMMRKLPQFVSRLFGILMKMLEDVEDDPLWHAADTEEDEDVGETQNYGMGQECLDRLAISLGGNTIVPVASEILPAYLGAPDWQKHHAALICLAQIAEGCSKNEVIKPTVNGVLSIIKSCIKAKTVKRLVFTSSAGTVNVQKSQKPMYDESDWSDLDFVKEKRMTAWMYFVSKTTAELAAWEAAKENNIDFISIIPTLVVGPFIMPTFPPSLITALSPITGNEAHYSIIKQCQFVHLDDLCESHIFLYEHSQAEGRYICSSHHATIYELTKMMREKWPEYKNIPTEFEGIDKDLANVCFSSKKLIGMGFEFKYSLEDMFRGAIDTCKEKGLLPDSA